MRLAQQAAWVPLTARFCIHGIIDVQSGDVLRGYGYGVNLLKHPPSRQS